MILLYGCAPETSEIEEKILETSDVQEPLGEQEIIANESELVKSQFAQMVEAIHNDDKEGFLEFQNSANSLFYKEQIRWLEETAFKKKQGYTISVNIGEVNLLSSEKGTIELIVNMKYEDNESHNKVTYSIIKLNNMWVVDDVPFKVISEGNITVFYVSSLEEKALSVLKEATDITGLYNDKFGWKSGEITIKLYDSREQVSATVPWSGLTGWNETGESLKLMTDTSSFSSFSFKVLVHELAHKMLSDFSNDNVSLYIQEGFAGFLQSVVERDETGKPSINLNNLAEEEQQLLMIEELVLLNISDLNELDYNQGLEINALGFLLTDYLITTQGFEKFLTMVNELLSEPYIDSRTEHKFQTLSERTTNALEKVYGPTSQLSEDYISYFINKK